MSKADVVVKDLDTGDIYLEICRYFWCFTNSIFFLSYALNLILNFIHLLTDIWLHCTLQNRTIENN